MPQNSRSAPGPALSFGPFRLSAAERILYREDEPVPLGSRALDILIALVERAGEVVSRRELIRQVWPDLVVEEANLRVHITYLRRALQDGQDGARYVANVPGRGYCFVAPVEQVAAPEGARPVPAAPAPQNLPPRLERMVGRDEAVAELSALLMRHRFVSLVGAGGMGKTTVGIAVCHALLKEFEGAIHFVDLGVLSDAALVEAAIRSTLGVAAAGSSFEGLLACLADRRALLVLDNCEHLIDAVASVATRIFAQASQMFILATSREALRVEGEHLHLLPPLETPPAGLVLKAEEALGWPAVLLFMERAAAGGHRFPLTDGEAPLVASICRQLDGMALAIELAAGRVGACGIQGTADLLGNRFRLLWEGRRNALPRHQTMRAMLDWSYNLLSPVEQRVLSRLSIFAGPFAPCTARVVVADDTLPEREAAEALAVLIDKSLVWVSTQGGQAQHRLLDTTRSYAMLRLEEAGERNLLARRHALHCLEVLRGREVQAAGRELLPADGISIGNIRAALEWCFSAEGDLAIGVKLATRSAPLFIGLSLLDECRRWCAVALSSLDGAGGDAASELALQEALAISAMFTRGNGLEIRGAIERGLVLAEALDDQERQLNLVAGLHLFLMRTGDFRGALDMGERGAALAAAAGCPDAAAMADWMLGTACHFLGNHEAAQHHCEMGFRRAAALGPIRIGSFGCDHHVRGFIVLARVLWLRGQPERARRVARQAISAAEQHEHPVALCIALLYTTTVALWDGDHTTAGQRIDRLIRHAAMHSLAPYHAVGLALRGELAISLNQPETGVSQLRDALAALHADRYTILTTVFQRAFAEGLAAAGSAEEADFAIDGALATAMERGASYEMPDLLRAKGEILLALSRPDQAGAEQAFRQSLAAARTQAATAWELRAAVLLAHLLLRQGRSGEASELLEEVLPKSPEGGSAMAAALQLLREIQGAAILLPGRPS